MSSARPILSGLVAGLALAAALAGPLQPWSDQVLPVTNLIGTLFLNALKMVALPLIVTTLIASLGGLRQPPGRLGGIALACYLANTTLAIAAGLLMANLLTPGLRSSVDVAALLASPASGLPEATAHGWESALLLLVPGNLTQAAAQGNLVALVLAAVMLGLALRLLPDDLRSLQHRFWEGLQQMLMTITLWVLRVAPLGVFALVTSSASQLGWSVLTPLLWFMATVLLALLLHAAVNLGLVLWRLARVSPVEHARAMSPALWMAFSTASSAATLPLTLSCLNERARVSPQVTGLTVPLGASLNMDGTALYECVAVLFIAQLLGADLGLGEQLVIVLMALATSTGMAGIPAASLVAIALILDQLGLPAEALALLLVTDRPLDMLRTTVNVWSDSVAARVVARYADRR